MALNSIKEALFKAWCALSADYFTSLTKQFFPVQVAIEIPSPSLLLWLKAQSIYPQSYLNFRDERKTIVGLGEAIAFTDLNEAEHFCQQRDYCLLGGRTFNGENYFFLPRLTLSLEKSQLTVTYWADLSQPFDAEVRLFLSFLSTFEKKASLEPLPQLSGFVSQSLNEEAWQQKVEKAVASIEKNHFQKVVLANDFIYQTTNPLNPYDFLMASEKQNRDCYHFLWAENEEKTFVGSSPERLFLRQENHLFTEALAGTAFVTENKEETKKFGEWLLNDQKNQTENLLVVENIQQSLESLSEEFICSPCELKKLKNVQHLKRNIQCQLKPSVQDAEPLSLLHPTAAVAGLPRENALSFLKQEEPFERGWYAGTFGIMTKNASEFCVTIRSANIWQNYLQVFAGAGIVAGSNAHTEWQEINRKASGLLSLLNKE